MTKVRREKLIIAISIRESNCGLLTRRVRLKDSSMGAIAPVELGGIVSRSRGCIGSIDGSRNRQRSVRQ
jgi:hypothetical protein